MYRRYREYRQRRRHRNTEYRRRPMLMRPSVQIAILLIAALIIYLILQCGVKLSVNYFLVVIEGVVFNIRLLHDFAHSVWLCTSSSPRGVIHHRKFYLQVSPLPRRHSPWNGSTSHPDLTEFAPIYFGCVLPLPWLV